MARHARRRARPIERLAWPTSMRPPARRAAFAAELRRVGRGWFVQTPARSFPIEPHSLLPGAHWLAPGLRRIYWHLGAAGGWEQIELLRRSELERLFGPARPERFGP